MWCFHDSGVGALPGRTADQEADGLVVVAVTRAGNAIRLTLAGRAPAGNCGSPSARRDAFDALCPQLAADVGVVGHPREQYLRAL
ncbi:MAG: hypothetical protein ACT4OZ_07675 [Gemmatimonadota bacterium]